VLRFYLRFVLRDTSVRGTLKPRRFIRDFLPTSRQRFTNASASERDANSALFGASENLATQLENCTRSIATSLRTKASSIAKVTSDSTRTGDLQGEQNRTSKRMNELCVRNTRRADLLLSEEAPMPTEILQTLLPFHLTFDTRYSLFRDAP